MPRKVEVENIVKAAGKPVMLLPPVRAIDVYKRQVQVYVESPGQKERWNLCGFAPVALAPGQEKQVVLPLSKAAFCRYDDKGDLYTLPGRHTLHIGFSQPDERSVQLCGTAPVAVTLDIQ